MPRTTHALVRAAHINFNYYCVGTHAQAAPTHTHKHTHQLYVRTIIKDK